MQSLWMLLASLLFACMGVCVKLASQTHAAAEIVFYRSFISLILMGALVRWRGVSLHTVHWRWQVSRGLVGFIALFTYFYAIALLPLATAVTLNYTSAIFLALYLALTGARLRRGMLLALVIGLAGVVVLLKPTFDAELWLGGLVGLGSGALAGMAYFNVRELGQRGEPEIRTVFYFSLISSLCSGIWLAFNAWTPVSLREAVLLLGVAVFATLAQLAMTRAYTRGKTLLSAALAYSTVIFSSLFGILLWGETLDMWSGVAVALIMVSGLMATAMSRRSA